MSQIAETVKETLEQSDTESSWLNATVAVLVAVTATFMALAEIKDGNTVQAMAQAQSRAVSAWAHFQAKSQKQTLSEYALVQSRMRLETEPNLAETARHQLLETAALYDAEVRRYEHEKQEIKQQAENYEREYDRLNVHDDQFDMAEACLTVAIALYGVTALTRSLWLLGLSVAFNAVGTLLGLAGFNGWGLHAMWLARLLG